MFNPFKKKLSVDEFVWCMEPLTLLLDNFKHNFGLIDKRFRLLEDRVEMLEKELLAKEEYPEGETE